MSGNDAFTNVPSFPPEYRASDLLLQVMSLPSPYGIGHLGSSAFSWIDSVHDASQRGWQALALGPTGYGNSPHQSLSWFAGNALLTSPGSLVSDRLLQTSECQSHFSADVVDYGPACRSCSGVDASGMVLIGGARHYAVAGSAQPGQRNSYATCPVVPMGTGVSAPEKTCYPTRLPMAAGFDAELKALGRFCDFR
jgi:hypothetical protein